MSDYPPEISVMDFFFALPLYSRVSIPADGSMHASIYQKAGHIVSGETWLSPEPILVVDGHCPRCGTQATFSIQAATSIPNGDSWTKVFERISFDEVRLSCTRRKHLIRYYFFIEKLTIMKVGQFPSLADIANDEASTYRSVLNKEDAAELHKAIGLAAHGVGIGSFVYLRRIFERLVLRRFNEFKDIEGWKDDDFRDLRMNEKVSFLKGHLPDFLVENSRLYSILSLGIHELSDQTCLSAFEPIKLSIKIILEEDKRKQEELELRKRAAAAIANFKI
jgi:hypothetical protein